MGIIHRRDAEIACLLLVTLVSILAPMLAPHDPIETNLGQRLAPIGTPFWAWAHSRRRPSGE